MDGSHDRRRATGQGSAAEDLWRTHRDCNAQASWSTKVSGLEGGHQPPADSRDFGALEGNWPRLADTDGGRSEGVGVSAIQPPLGADASRCSSYWSEEERGEFAAYISEFPNSGDVVPQSGGIRKVRWRRAGTGKSGGVAFFSGSFS